MAAIPVIDIGGLASSSEKHRSAVRDKVMQAATDIGFLQVDSLLPPSAVTHLAMPINLSVQAF